MFSSTLCARLALALALALPAAIGWAADKPGPRPDPRVDAEKQADMARFQVLDRSDQWLTAVMPEPDGTAAERPQAEPQPLGGIAGSLGSRRGDMDRHFGDVALPGRTRLRFNIGNGLNDLYDHAFGLAVTDGDYPLVIGEAGSLANGTRLALAWYRPDGRLASERLVNGRQTLEVIWGGNNTYLSFSKAAGVFGQVGPVSLSRFYVLGRLDLMAGDDWDFDFVVLCLHHNGSLFVPCPGFGTLGNGMARVAFDVGGVGFHKDIPYDLHIDPVNEKLLLAGAAQLSGGSPPGSDYDFAVARLDLHSGALDTSFNGTGKRTIWFDLNGGNPWDAAQSIHVRPLDGKIVVAGLAYTGVTGNRSAMAQLNPDGSLDGAFCAPAVASCDSPPTHRSGRRLWQDELGVSGTAATVLGGDPATADTLVVRRRVISTTDTYGAISRVAADGGCTQCAEAWHWHFPINIPIVATMDLPSVSPGVSNPGIVVAGYGRWNDGGILRTFALRVHYTSMTLDDTFSSGIDDTHQTYDFPVSPGEEPVSAPAAIAVDSRGRYLIAGRHRWHENSNDWDFALARLQNDVIFDHGFDYGGPQQ